MIVSSLKFADNEQILERRGIGKRVGFCQLSDLNPGTRDGWVRSTTITSVCSKLDIEINRAELSRPS